MNSRRLVGTDLEGRPCPVSIQILELGVRSNPAPLVPLITLRPLLGPVQGDKVKPAYTRVVVLLFALALATWVFRALACRACGQLHPCPRRGRVGRRIRRTTQAAARPSAVPASPRTILIRSSLPEPIPPAPLPMRSPARRRITIILIALAPIWTQALSSGVRTVRRRR